MTSAAEPVWTDPLYLRSHFGRLLQVAANKALEISQLEADAALKNLVIARPAHGQVRGGWRLFRLRQNFVNVPSRQAIIECLADPSEHVIFDRISVEELPGPEGFALRRDGLYLGSERDGRLGFVTPVPKSWEVFEAIKPGYLAHELWRPVRTMGGTQLMAAGLTEQLGIELAAINLQLNRPDISRLDARPLVVWLHNKVRSDAEWCNDKAKTDAVAAFVFVSEWQRQGFLSAYPALPAERCHVIRNATDAAVPRRTWPDRKPWRWRCAYTSAPNRGLAVLLDAWERLEPADAELHIWSSFRLWGSRYTDTNHQAVFAQARRLPGVTYHGIRPNAEIREALREMHFLAYPSTFLETSCISVIEAMAAGVRVVTPALAALPETTAGYAQLYQPVDGHDAHVDLFASKLAEEFASPWGGQPELAAAAQDHVRNTYDWNVCRAAWRSLIQDLCSPRRMLFQA